jgi:hypothetical protein
MSLLLILTLLSFAGALFSVPSAPGAGDVILKLIIFGITALGIALRVHVPVDRMALRLIWPFVAVILFSGASALYHTQSVVYTLAAVQAFVLGFILYLCLVLSPLANRVPGRALRSLAYGLIGVQFLFALVKLATHGIDEKVLIGTMSHGAGQLGFLIPAIAVPIIVYLQRPGNQVLTWTLIAAMFAFGIINEKRSVIFVLPLILLAAVLMKRGTRLFRPTLGNIVALGAIAAVCVAGVALGIAFMPSLNQSSAYGGDVSVSFAVMYARDYLLMDYGGNLQGSYATALVDTGVQVGRLILWFEILRWLFAQDWTSMLFGIGFGAVTPSSWIQQSIDPLFELLGTRGALSGAGLALIETGLIGLALMTTFFVALMIATVRLLRRCVMPEVRGWLKTTILIQLVFWYDFFFYSTSLFRILPLPLLLFATVASLVIASRWERAHAPQETAVAPS